MSRSAEPSLSSLLLSNIRVSCRAGSTADALGDCIAFLRNDRNIAPAPCGIDRTNQQSFQLDECGEIDARAAKSHSGADDGIKHPPRHRDHNAGWPQHLKKLPSCSLLDTTDGNLAAKIRVPPVMDFQLLPDMGRMNG
ncbi:hypothetical protein WOC76_21435 [Methylocystis sp. IM3]|uniref:hypothetical protein n=1 Tax=unclassified Methylocystis TaxID=2625913 RepID=UPI0030F6590A